MLNTLNLRRFLLITSDIILLYFSLIVVVFWDFREKHFLKTLDEHLVPFSILYFFWLIIFYIFGLYDLSLIRIKETFRARMPGALSTALILGLIFFYLFPFFELTPKTNLVLNVLIFTVLQYFWRKIFLTLFSSKFLTKIVIVGQAQKASELAEEINARPHLGYRLIELKNDKDLMSQIKEQKIDTILVPPDLAFNSELIKNLYQCLPARVKFLDWTSAYEIITGKIPVLSINHIWFLQNLKGGKKIFYDMIKRALDVIWAGIIFILTMPIWLIIMILIKLEDGGPVIYTQERIGKDKRPFLLFKFRSMKPEAEKLTGPLWAEARDYRATKVGAILRKIHLDELPQMINALKGEISLVGPRPERPEFVWQLEKEIPHYHLRHLIKPGFTGWAQLKFRYGRSIMDAKEKFQYDLYYIKNRSLFLDLGILLKTFQLFFKKE
ncbi:MAG: sugar transferase [Candidatus Nealsonbacteria bacterium]|nr:sugar transferase [Candidatus Nealsonbacteria bacterium]